ncbi:MAG: ribonuclease III [Polyangiaceae bacterium]|nr:ribonuclease III [Polyangiaceae bacterium]
MDLNFDRIAKLFRLKGDGVLFTEARTHPSYAHEHRTAVDNQRLEFLGDAILDFCVSEVLFGREPENDEGWLTRTRAQLVSTDALAAFAREHRLGEVLRVGKGAREHLLHSDNVLADLVEALLAATYCEGSLDDARQVARLILDFGLAQIEEAGALDPKSALQEVVQAIGRQAPRYVVLEQSGPAHATQFRVEVQIETHGVGVGEGRSKRLAERAAASRALASKAYEALSTVELSPESIESATTAAINISGPEVKE